MKGGREGGREGWRARGRKEGRGRWMMQEGVSKGLKFNYFLYFPP